MIDAESYTSVRLEVPNPYRLTETQSVLAQSTIIPWDMDAYPLLDRSLTTAGHNLFTQVVQKSYLGPLQLEVWLFGHKNAACEGQEKSAQDASKTSSKAEKKHAKTK